VAQLGRPTSDQILNALQIPMLSKTVIAKIGVATRQLFSTLAAAAEIS